MIYIAVCDDEKEKAQRTAKETAKCLEQNQVVYELCFFESGSTLLQAIEKGRKIDIVLLDIEMPQMDGMSLARELKLLNPDMLIIFITFYEKYVYESFQVQPYRFIPSRYLEQMLPEALMDAVRLMEDNRESYYLAENQKGVEKIPAEHILYIWHKEKYAYIEKADGTTTKVRKTLKQVYQELPREHFEWADKGIICNFAQIARFMDGNIVFTNGTQVAVSRKRIAEIKNILRRYWCKRGEKDS